MAAQGIALLDFGVLPGSRYATLFITAPSNMFVWSTHINALLAADSTTTDHSPDEHLAESIRISAAGCTAGGFTIYGQSDSPVYGQFAVKWFWE